MARSCPGLVAALASLRDPTGRILIDGCYDDVVPLGEREHDAIANMPDAMRIYGAVLAGFGDRQPL